MAKNVKKESGIEKKSNLANDILNMIVGKTFARHSKLTEEEYLKEIGFEGSGKTENEAFRIAIFNLLTQTTRELLRAKDSFRYASSLMALYLKGESIQEEKKGE